MPSVASTSLVLPSAVHRPHPAPETLDSWKAPPDRTTVFSPLLISSTTTLYERIFRANTMINGWIISQ